MVYCKDSSKSSAGESVSKVTEQSKTPKINHKYVTSCFSDPFKHQQPVRLRCRSSGVCFSCTPPGLLSPQPRQDRAHLQSYFDEPPSKKSPGFKLLEDQSTNRAVIISYCSMNTSFIKERQRYGTVVTAGPTSTRQMILSAIHTCKNSAGRPRSNG